MLVSRPPIFIFLLGGGGGGGGGDHYSLFIIQYYGILRVWFPGTAQIISKKRCGWCFKAIMKAEAVVETDAGGDEKLTFKFVWPNLMVFLV